jgi:hypothetical protein
MHVWKGTSVNISNDDYTNYLYIIKKHFFDEKNRNKISVIEEIPYSESDDFINLL